MCHIRSCRRRCVWRSSAHPLDDGAAALLLGTPCEINRIGHVTLGHRPTPPPLPRILQVFEPFGRREHLRIRHVEAARDGEVGEAGVVTKCHCSLSASSSLGLRNLTTLPPLAAAPGSALASLAALLAGSLKCCTWPYGQ